MNPPAESSMSHTNASLEKPTSWYKKVNITSRHLAISFYAKHPELLTQFNDLVQKMNDDLCRTESDYQRKITAFVATHQETLSEHARTTFIEEKIAAKSMMDVSSAAFDASDAILRAFRAKRTEEITRMKTCRDACNITPENLKHLRMLLQLIKEGDDLDDIVYG